MKSLFQLTIAATAATAGLTAAFTCDIPTNGCTNGMFHVEKCECQCIPPYCPDWFGDCTNPNGSCGGNPWVGCERGLDCPWWPNPLKLEACTTGPVVPLDMWEIYNTRSACCNSKFPYSDICAAEADEGPPTKYPTIQAPEEDVYEVVPIKFDVMGLPDDISMRELKNEMATVLKRVVLRLAERIPGLKVTSVEERVVVTRNLIKSNLRNNLLNEDRDAVGHQTRRGLEQDVALYYNVYVLREKGRKFGPLIISEIRNSYSEVLEQVQTFADTKFFGGDLNLNWCTSENGQYENCVQDITPPAPMRAPAPTVIVQSDPPPDEGGLAGWAIAIIIIFVLLFLCCVGYAIAVFCFGAANCFAPNDYDKTEINNNMYYGEEKQRGFVDEDNYTRDERNRRSRRSRRHEEENVDEVQIVLADPQDPQFDDDSFTVNTYGTRKPGRDPTMYIPGQEDKPDPDSSERSSGSRRTRKYMEDPPLKPKRDPTMYVQGGHGDYSAEDPPLKPKRDPTMFVEGQMDPSMYAEGQQDPSFYADGGQDPSFYVDGQRDPTMYQSGDESAFSINHSADPYGMAGIDDSEFSDRERYGFGATDQSFKTQEPSVGGSRKKKSKKKKSSR